MVLIAIVVWQYGHGTTHDLVAFVIPLSISAALFLFGRMAARHCSPRVCLTLWLLLVLICIVGNLSTLVFTSQWFATLVGGTTVITVLLGTTGQRAAQQTQKQ
jgi:phosphoglycerol transferase MdoB-like AlkP superfamily enzyme